MVKVFLDAWLREFGAPPEVTLEALDVGRLLDQLEARYPRLRFRLRDETGAVRRFVKIFLDGEELDGDGMLGTSLSGALAIDILHSIAGG